MRERSKKSMLVLMMLFLFLFPQIVFINSNNTSIKEYLIVVIFIKNNITFLGGVKETIQKKYYFFVLNHIPFLK